MGGLIPYGRQDVTDADVDAVAKTLRSDYLTQGPAVGAFEAALGDYLGARHVVAVANGTAALHLAYAACGVGPGDAVFVPALTFAATANAARYCGATPVFVDIEPDSLCIAPASLEAAVSLAEKQGLKPRIVAPVHYAGRPADMTALTRIAAKKGMHIVEDACHALGGEYRLNASSPWVRVGASDFAHLTCFSFHPVKHITTGEGGAVSTSDPSLAKRVAMLRTHGITKDASEYVFGDRAHEANGKLRPWYHEMQILGWNYRLCDIQAVLGTNQIARLPVGIIRRRQIAAAYDKAFSGLPHATVPPADTSTAKHAYHLYPIAFDYEALGKNRTAVMEELRERGVGTQVHYIPVYKHPYYERTKDACLRVPAPIAERFYERELSLPMYAALNDEALNRVIQAVSTVIRSSR